MSPEHMVIVWSAAITALIVFILFAITHKNKFVNKIKDQARKDLYDVVVKQVFSEKEKLEEQIRISVAEKKLIEKQLEEKTFELSSINDRHKSALSSTYTDHRRLTDRYRETIMDLEKTNEALEKEKQRLTKKLQSYFLISDIRLCDLITERRLRDAADSIRNNT